MVNRPPPKSKDMSDNRCHIVSGLVRQGAGRQNIPPRCLSYREEEDHPDHLVSLENITYALVIHFFIVLSVLFVEKLLFSDGSCQRLELLASIFHVLEEVEACAAWAQEYGVARLCQFLAGCHAILHAVGVADRDAECVKVVVQLLVVSSQVIRYQHISPSPGP